MVEEFELSESMEDYLEVIHHLVKDNRVARVRDIANALTVKMPSVTGALRKLSKKGLVNYDPHQVITLTDRGEEIAKKIIRTHQTIARFLSNVLDIEPTTADENACRMEHAIDDVVLNRLIKYIEFVEDCPLAGAKFSEKTDFFCEHAVKSKDCEQCMEIRLKNYRKGILRKDK